MSSKKKNKNNSIKKSSEKTNTQKNEQEKEKKEVQEKVEKKEKQKAEEKVTKVEEKKIEARIEKVVFNNDKKNKEEKNAKHLEPEKKPLTKADEAKHEILEKKENTKRKIGAASIILISILFIALISSTGYAFIYSTKNTIANGVRINNIELSGLTKDEAKTKLNEALKTILDVEIELEYEDYHYRIKAEDVELSFDFQKELDDAYNIGRDGNVVQCNYQLLGTAFFGKNFNINYKFNEDDVDKIIDEISTNIPGLVKQYSYYIDENNLVINPGIDGIQVEKEKLKQIIINNLNNRNPIEIAKNFKNEKFKIPCEDAKADPIDMNKVYEGVHKEPENAYFIAATETEKAKIFTDVDGIDFAISIDEAKEKLNEESDEYIIPLSRQKAEITINDIGLEAFPNKLQEFSTNYDASNWGRSENLKIATRKIDGTVLMPGDQFSFNGVVGERTVQAGYKNAAIFQGDQVVDGLAGGICQVSSTLYNAAILANLQIDERYNHSFKTSYLAFGRDATVVYGVKDLKFTNTRSYPIKIEGVAENGVVNFAIYGIEEDEEYKISIIPVITSTIPYDTQTVTDYSIAAGASYVSQGGSSGARVTTYKEMVLNGEVVSKEVITNDIYKAMPRIVKVGPAVASTVAEPVSESVTVSEPTPEPEPVPESKSAPAQETESASAPTLEPEAQ